MPVLTQPYYPHLRGQYMRTRRARWQFAVIFTGTIRLPAAIT